MTRPAEELERDPHQINVKECESLTEGLTATSFFQSLQLQTVNNVGAQEEPRAHASKERLDDLSFFESIGLNWVNAADRTNDTGTETQETAVTNTEEKKEKNLEQDQDQDEFDFLNVLGLTPVTGSSHGKRWRLWNPEVDGHSWEDDINYICHGIDIQEQEASRDTPATDPTIMEHQHFHIANSSRSQDLPETQDVTQSTHDRGEAEDSSKADDRKDTQTELNITNRPKRTVKKRKIFEEVPNSSKKLKSSESVERTERSVKESGSLLVCGSCGATVSRHQYGKHLVSHYHYHRSLGHPDNNNIILDNIQHIVSQSPFQCQVCHFYCNRHSDLVSHFHQQSHTQQGRFWCQVCMKIILDQNMLVSHLNSFNHTELVSVINRSVPVIIKQISLVACNICDKEFRFNLGLKKHMQSVHGETNYQLENQKKYYCDYCEYFSYKLSSVKTHSFLVHPNPRLKYDCHICKQQFLSKETARAHRNSKAHKLNVQLKKEVTDQVTCCYCSQEFMDNQELKTHLETKHPLDLPQCLLCSERFFFQQELSVHLKSTCPKKSSSTGAEEQSRYNCTECSFSTGKREILTLHESYNHSKSDETASSTCPICCVHVNSLRMMDHIRSHEDQLSDSDTTERKLKKSKREEESKFYCSQCSYQGSSKILLNLHFKRQHQTDKEKIVFRCSQCRLEFKSNSSLKNHFRNAHSGTQKVPKYVCKMENCDFQCTYPSDLERHQLKHSDSKNLHCNDCDFSCKRRSELLRHYKLVHQDSPYLECTFCDYKTKTAHHLKRHISNLHKLNQVSYFEIHLDENDFMVGKTDLC